jgi:putative salt-induced outer membrane protein
MIRRIKGIRSYLVLFVFFVFGWATAASAAEIVVKGRDLEGSVVGFTDEGVEFETVYGAGSIVIPWDSTESISTENEFVVLYSDELLAIGRVWGYKDGELLVGADLETATHIPVSQIIRSLTREKYESSKLEALRVRYRFWHANFDLAWAYTDATTETNSLALGLEFTRKKKPTELFLAAYYRYATTKNQGEATEKTEDLFYAPGRFDYDFSDRLYGFGAISYERDEIQGLKARTDPNVGLGYRFVQQDDLTISGRIGPGYVYQKYFVGTTDDYFTILFGGDLDADLPYDSKLRVRLTYMPSVSDWADNYLIRGALDWTTPIVGMLDFKFTIFDTYNSQPAPNTKKNSFLTTVGFSFRF